MGGREGDRDQRAPGLSDRRNRSTAPTCSIPLLRRADRHFAHTLSDPFAHPPVATLQQFAIYSGGALSLVVLIALLVSLALVHGLSKPILELVGPTDRVPAAAKRAVRSAFGWKEKAKRVA